MIKVVRVALYVSYATIGAFLFIGALFAVMINGKGLSGMLIALAIAAIIGLVWGYFDERRLEAEYEEEMDRARGRSREDI